jgi:uncharacterized membrane protein
MLRKLNALIVHTGFWTYALITVLVLLGISVVAPVLFRQIVEALSQLGRAVRGG